MSRARVREQVVRRAQVAGADATLVLHLLVQRLAVGL